MAADELRFRVTADGADAAAKEVAKVQDAVDKLEGTAAQVTVEADDEATAVLDEAQGSVDDLDGADATVAVDADDEATEPLEGVQGAVDSLDGSGATVTAEADDEASDVLSDVAGAVDDIDGQDASVEIEADDNASGPIGNVTDKLGGLADAAGHLPGPLGEISSLISGIGSSGAGAAAGVAGLAAGFGAIALNGINQFKDLAVEVDNFSTKTGASLDASSRFIEVAKDLDVGVANIETSLGRMNKVAGETPEKFDEIGASLVKNDQGNVDSVETFISVLDALNKMPDASSRATAGNDIFGRGWQNMSELVGMSADELRTRLQGVSDTKIFDENKVAQGQGLRDALDAISDSADDLFLSIGQSLAPAIGDLAPAMADAMTALAPLISGIADGLVPALEAVTPLIEGVTDSAAAWESIKVPGWLKDIGQAFINAVSPIDSFKSHMADMKEEFGGTPELVGSVGTAFDTLASAQDDTAASAEAAKAAAQAYDDQLNGQIAALQGVIDAQNELTGAMSSYADLTVELQDKSASFTDTLAKYNATAADGTKTQTEIDKAVRDTTKSAASLADSVVEVTVEQDRMNGATTSATAKLDAQNSSLLNQAATASGPARGAILDYTFALNQIPPEVESEIRALIDQGKLAEANALLADASRNRDATVIADTDNASLNQANRQLDDAAKNRTATIYVRTTASGVSLGNWTGPGTNVVMGPAAATPATVGVGAQTAAVTPTATATALGVNPATGKFELPIEALLDDLPTAAEIARKIGRVRIPADVYVRTNPRINGAVPT